MSGFMNMNKNCHPYGYDQSNWEGGHIFIPPLMDLLNCLNDSMFKVSPIEINQLQLEIVIHELEGTLTVGILPFSYIPHSGTMRMTRWCIISLCSPLCLYRKIDSDNRVQPKKKKKKVRSTKPNLTQKVH